MPVEVGIWKLGEKPISVDFESMDSEDRLEEVLAQDTNIIDPNLILIGRQVPTDYGKRIDLLALDGDGNLVVMELKRDRTPREIVAQLLDYGSWVRTLEDDDIALIFEEHSPLKGEVSLDQAFCERFDVPEMPESLNEKHELVIIASELDPSTERIVNYLSDEYGVVINAVYFRYFQEDSNEYLTRVWLIDPTEVETKAVERRERLPWNGEFYVSFGVGEHRQWADARKYGFISAGGGDWYTRTLDLLEEGKRVWVNVPGHGYVGVGKVTGSKTPLKEFKVQIESGEEVAIEKAPLKAGEMIDSECFVPVEWIETVSLEGAIKEKGFFGNQNTVARPKVKKWIHTVDRLKKRFGIED